MEEETVIIAALSSLSLPHLSDLTHSLLSFTLHHRRRLSRLLSSPTLFFLTLQHLHSLSLPNKTLLIARHLLSSLHLITRHFQPPPPHPSTTINHRDLDAVLLLLLLCETHQHDPKALEQPYTEWRPILSKFYSDTMLTIGCTGGGTCDGAVLLPFIEMVSRCRKFIGVMGCDGNEGRELAASPAAVVALPAVEVSGGGVECVICKEEMREGRDACELPCQHLFHWICILPWLKKRNTCPCCRFELPSDDVYGEIERLWDVLAKAGSGKVMIENRHGMIDRHVGESDGLLSPNGNANYGG
ncbi:hypothetical protein SLEP1_g17701 [Rubroshorea leprosula]|uniref:RING-type E3 ubiquitin transferase n=1 Tax=Rubroshorea leprosula TaxID=152421 RepID=A0AAV5J455_9ROSI|nr:hypothetical protein SLEP1_g17701 [Rubroshorea leprosula]